MISAKEEVRLAIEGALERLAKERADILRRVELIDQDLAWFKRLQEKYPDQRFCWR